jgi:hypothetical protein
MSLIYEELSLYHPPGDVFRPIILIGEAVRCNFDLFYGGCCFRASRSGPNSIKKAANGHRS